jgi:S1-C subfamily serine protease
MMRRLTLAVALPLFAVCSLAAADWQAVVRETLPKVPRLEILDDGSGDQGVCSAVVFAIDQSGEAEALTAGHCVKGEHLTLTVNRRHAAVVLKNGLLDLAVVTFQAKGEQAIAFAANSPAAGAEVAIVGYPFGNSELAAQFGRVSQSWNPETKTLWANVDLIFGDSGSPLIDEQGRLVGINSRTYYAGPNGQMAHMASAVSIEDVADFVAAYQKGRGRK